MTKLLFKRHHVRLLLCAGGLALLSACSTPKEFSAPAEAQELHAQLTAAVEAWNRGDLPRHLAIYEPNATKMTADGPETGVAPMQAAFARAYFAPGKPRTQLSLSDLRIRPLNPGSALMTGRFTLTPTPTHGTRPRDGATSQSGWFTLVWVQTSRGWKVVHDHSGA